MRNVVQVVVVLACVARGATALAAAPMSASRPLSVARRDALRTLLTLPALVAAPAIAETPVGEGGLPEGALQFDRFLKVQAEWKRFGARLATGAEIDASEWEATALFLRRLYDAGDDMLVLARNLDADKKAQAKTLAADFRATVRAADRSVKSNDRDAVLAAYDRTAGMMTSLLDLLQDVPDEL